MARGPELSPQLATVSSSSTPHLSQQNRIPKPRKMADFSGARQLLLEHAFLPLISVQSTHNADVRLQQQCQNPLISALSVLSPYGNNAQYGLASQTFRITNTLLITRSYALFPVRFEPSLPELLTVHNPSDDKLSSLFSVSSLEHLMRNISVKPHDSLYLSMFRRIITSNRVVLFDTVNHPVAQVFIVDHGRDSIEVIRRLVVEFRNYAFPKYFQNLDLLMHLFVLYSPSSVSEAEMLKYQATLRTELSLSSTAIPVSAAPVSAAAGADPDEFVRVPELSNATIEQEIQSLSLQQAHAEDSSGLRVPKELDVTLRAKIHEFISRSLIPHMERKIRTWDDSVLAPKKSITGRFFSVSRKLFNNSSGETAQHSTTPGSYNHVGNFYHRSAPEQIIRKLADWSLMLKDFKYAYLTYDLIKKDYTNDKAWAYVASTQEMCIVSLLLAQTQPLASDTLPQKPDKNTLRKIRHDIIEPYVDNLSYTYKLRFNVKTYAVRSYLVVAELLLNMSMMFNIPWWWSDLIEDYILNAENELAAHLAAAGKSSQATRAILYERLGYVKKNCYFVPPGRRDIINDILEHGIVQKPAPLPEDGFYVNRSKMMPSNDNAIKGLTRFRKSSFWYIMSMKEWMLLENNLQIRSLMENLRIRYPENALLPQSWYSREDLVLARIKRFAQQQA